MDTMRNDPYMSVSGVVVPYTELDQLSMEELLDLRDEVYTEVTEKGPGGQHKYTERGNALYGGILAMLNTEIDRRERETESN